MKFILTLILLSTSCTVFAADLFKSASDAFNSTKAPAQQPDANTAGLSSGLASALMQSLGVSDKQATGGLGSLFGLAKSTLSSQQFARLASAVPGMDSLLSVAPQVQAGTKSLGGLSGALGDYGEALDGASKVYSQFQSLGLDASAIPQYIDVTNSYLQSNGGQKAAELFSTGVSSLL